VRNYLVRYSRGWEGEIVLLLSVGDGGGEELLGGAEGTETLSAGGSVLLGAHSFLLLAAGKLEMGSAGLARVSKVSSLPTCRGAQQHDEQEGRAFA
jgi:hypothetical protein